jgi:hypothetical protein
VGLLVARKGRDKDPIVRLQPPDARGAQIQRAQIATSVTAFAKQAVILIDDVRLSGKQRSQKPD